MKDYTVPIKNKKVNKVYLSSRLWIMDLPWGLIIINDWLYWSTGRCWSLVFRYALTAIYCPVKFASRLMSQECVLCYSGARGFLVFFCFRASHIYSGQFLAVLLWFFIYFGSKWFQWCHGHTVRLFCVRRDCGLPADDSFDWSVASSTLAQQHGTHYNLIFEQ